MQWYYIVGILTAFPFQSRAAVGSSSYLLPAPGGCLQEGGTQTAVGLGREIKHQQLQQAQAAPQPDATEEDRKQTLNSGWMHPWARRLLDCVGSLDRYQAERGPGARWAWHHDVPATQTAEQLHRDKSTTTYPSNEKHFQGKVFAYCLCTTQHSAKALVAFLVFSK